MSEPDATPAPNAANPRRFRRLALRLAIVLPAALAAALGIAFAAGADLKALAGAAPEPADDESPARFVTMKTAERHETEEGKMGKVGVGENKTNRSAPKALDISEKDLVKDSGLLRTLGGSRVGDSGGFGGLGLRGTGAGGAGMGTMGLGGIGTRGRGGGLGYGDGFPADRRPPDDLPVQALKAGATDDNADFEKYVKFLASWSDRGDTAGLADLVDVRDRRYVKVVDAKGLPIPTAALRILDQASQAETAGTSYGDGRLPFYPRAAGKAGARTAYQVEASFGGQTARATWDGAQDLTLSFDADRAVRGAIQLDVLFALDTTGSMNDEIDRIKATLLSVTEKLRALPQSFDLRYGAVLYRDRGDDYVTRALPFTSDVRAFAESLRRVEAAGGGDEAESVNRALVEAVAAPWRPGAAKVVFLIGDAPPHMDYGNDVRYGEAMKAALARGIRVHSVAASGLNALGTLVWRQVAQYTRGKFVFIEYGSAQATAASHGVAGSYKSNNLDDIVFEQIRDELEGWGKGEPGAVAQARAEAQQYAGPIQLHPRGP